MHVGQSGTTTSISTSEGDRIRERQARRESNARTYARNIPIVPVRASGLEVTGADGKVYLDCLAGAGTLALGHNHPAVVSAMQAFLSSGAPQHMLDFPTPEKDAFTTQLLASFPREFAANARIQFCGPSGADAVEAAIKLVKIATGRSGVFAFHGAYHGQTHGTLALNGNTEVRARIPNLMQEVTFLSFPSEYRCPFGLGGEAGVHEGLHQVEEALETALVDGALPAAIILEVVQGEAGSVPAPNTWVRGVADLARRYEVALIVDEIQTGVGRTGTMWGFEQSGIVPDVVVCSKAIGGGQPIAVTVYDARLDLWMPGAHAGTFRGNQIAMIAGITTLQLVEQLKLPDRAVVAGRALLQGLRQIAASFDVIGDVRGRGLMVGAEIVDPTSQPDKRGALLPDGTFARTVQRAALDRGLIVELGGPHEAVVRFLPPLIVSDDEITSILERFDRAIDDVVASRVVRSA